jgi:hypothetical protein
MALVWFLDRVVRLMLIRWLSFFCAEVHAAARRRRALGARAGCVSLLILFPHIKSCTILPLRVMHAGISETVHDQFPKFIRHVMLSRKL